MKYETLFKRRWFSASPGSWHKKNNPHISHPKQLWNGKTNIFSFLDLLLHATGWAVYVDKNIRIGLILKIHSFHAEKLKYLWNMWFHVSLTYLMWFLLIYEILGGIAWAKLYLVFSPRSESSMKSYFSCPLPRFFLPFFIIS